MSRCLLRWIYGEKRFFRRRFSENDISSINELLSQYNHYRPKEIHRKIRGLNHINYWKGTEFRVFLLYIGMVAVEEFLPQNEYEHYLILITAVTICSSDSYKQYLPKARELFIEYIEHYIEIYGIHSISSNVHNLCHIVDDIERFGPLDKISAYEFENELHNIKLLLKQCNKPLEQIARRLTEKLINKVKNKLNSNVKANLYPQVKQSVILRDDQNLNVFEEILLKKDFSLSKRMGDCWFLCKDNSQCNIVKFEYAIKHENTFLICGTPLKELNNFFIKPFSSKYLNIFKSNGEKNAAQKYQLKSIKAKMFCIPHKDNFVFVPLIHTM